MVLLSYKQASQPSPKLIIVASGINANNGGHEILLIHQVANSAHKHDHRKNIRSCKYFQKFSHI